MMKPSHVRQLGMGHSGHRIKGYRLVLAAML